MSAPSLVSNSNSSHTTNNAAHRSVPLAKRLLFPTTPDFPPLFLSTVPPELNAELYDFIALALRAFVQPWWTKITRYDKELLPIITEILTHVLRTVEERLAQAKRRGDLAELVFRDIPLIITQHYRDFRTAQSKLNSSYAAGGALSIPVLFHACQSHIAVKPGGEIDLDYVRFLVDHILRACLPKQDWDPEAERVIVREIIARIVANDIIGKVAQPWFIEKTMLDQLMSIPSAKPSAPRPHSNGLSFHSILVFVLTLIQSISGFCLALTHAYRLAVITIKEVNQHSGISETTSPTPIIPPPSQEASISPSSSSLPTDTDPLSVSQTPSERSASSLKPFISSSSVSPERVSASPLDLEADFPHDFATYPLLMLTEVFATDARFASSTIMSATGMIANQGVAGRWLDKFLPYILARTMSAPLLQTITRNAKRTLFPNGYPAPPPIDPTPEEQVDTRRSLVNFLDGNAVAPLLLGPHPSETISVALEPLESKECNVHLIIVLLDRILGVLFPELFDGMV